LMKLTPREKQSLSVEVRLPFEMQKAKRRSNPKVCFIFPSPLAWSD